MPEHLHNLKRVLSSKRFQPIADSFSNKFTRGAFFDLPPLYAVKHLGLSVAASGLAISAHYFVETLFKGAAGWQLIAGTPILNISFSLGMATLLLMKYIHSNVLVLGSAVFGLS